jgi:superkiller protein 3
LGQLYFTKGMPGQAQSAFAKALELAPNHQHAILGIARLAGLRGDWAEAATILEHALKADPQFMPGHGFLAVAYEHLGRAEDMHRHEALGGDTGFQMNDPLMNELHSLSSTSSVLVSGAIVARVQGDYDRAADFLNRALIVAPDDKDVRLAVALLLAEPDPADRAQLLEAKSHLETGLELDPTYAKMRHHYGRVLYMLGETAAARAQWEQVIQEEPEHAMALMKLGQLYRDRGDYARALEFYHRGLNVPRDTPFTLGQPAMGYQELGLTYWMVGRTDEALTAFQTAHELDPYLGTAYLTHAELLEELGRIDEAAALYRQAVSGDPNDVVTRLGFGNLLMRINRFPEAREQLEAGLSLKPRNPKALAALGYVHLQLSDIEEAVAHLRASIAIDPNFPLAHYHLGIALMRQGQRDEAIGCYETALELDPSFQAAREALAGARAPSSGGQ